MSARTRVTSSVIGMPTESIDLHSLTTKRVHGGTSQPKRFFSLSAKGRTTGGKMLSQDLRMGSQPICDGSTYTMPQRETVAGEATARSCTSKIMDMTDDMPIISPDMRQSFLLSSNGVDGTVKKHPLPIRDVVQLLLLCGSAVCDGEHAVGPFVGNGIEPAIQLAHRDGLGVEHVIRGRLLLGAARLHLGQRRSESAVHRRLGSVGVADNHEAMSYDDHLVQLRDLDEEVVGELQVRGDALEKRHVVGEELGQVDVKNRAEHQDVLILIRKGTLQVAGCSKDGHHSAHAVVVVVLCGQLLRAQFVGLHDLARERPRLEVARRQQHHLADHRVVGELGAAGVTRVHGDEAVAHHLQRQRRAFEDELLGVGRLGALNGEDLLRHDREHLEVNSIELVEASPRARGGEPLEELGHGDVIEAVGAIHHNALDGHRLAQILGRLRLAGAGWALGRAAEVELQRPHERAVAAVRQRGDDQAALHTHVLVPVEELGRDHAYTDALLGRVVAKLGQPVEVGRLRDTVFGHLYNHVTRVHVHYDERRERLACQLG
eukprot:scaffold2872_cov112-Isochrysis_galbana.AAC.17